MKVSKLSRPPLLSASCMCVNPTMDAHYSLSFRDKDRALPLNSLIFHSLPLASCAEWEGTRGGHGDDFSRHAGFRVFDIGFSSPL